MRHTSAIYPIIMKSKHTFILFILLLIIALHLSAKRPESTVHAVVLNYTYSPDGCITSRINESENKTQAPLNAPAQNVSFSISPTIAVDHINVKVEGDSDLPYTYNILNANGLICRHGVISESDTYIDISSIDPNHYIISFFKEGAVVASCHFTKQ